MRRHLVLTSESARHPFRQILPPAVLQLIDDESTTQQPATPSGSAISMADLRLFLMAYCACFMAVTTFIW